MLPAILFTLLLLTLTIGIKFLVRKYLQRLHTDSINKKTPKRQ